MEPLAGKCGAAVAIDPRDGRVLAIASTPTYDPNLAENNFAASSRINGALRARLAARQPGDQRPLHPRLHVQGRHRHGGARLGRFTPREHVRRPWLLHRVRQEGVQLRRPGRRRGLRPVDFPTAMEHSINSVFCNIGKELGPGARPRLREAVRLLRGSAARDALRGARCRAGSKGPALRPDGAEPGRPGPARLRTGAAARDAAPDGDGRRGDRERRHPHGAARGRPDRRPGRQRGHAHEPGAVPRRHEAVDGSRPDGHDEARCRSPERAPPPRSPAFPVAGKTGTAETGRPGQNDTWFIALRAGRRPACRRGRGLPTRAARAARPPHRSRKALIQTLLRGKRRDTADTDASWPGQF